MGFRFLVNCEFETSVRNASTENEDELKMKLNFTDAKMKRKLNNSLDVTGFLCSVL